MGNAELLRPLSRSDHDIFIMVCPAIRSSLFFLELKFSEIVTIKTPKTKPSFLKSISAMTVFLYINCVSGRFFLFFINKIERS